LVRVPEAGVPRIGVVALVINLPVVPEKVATCPDVTVPPVLVTTFVVAMLEVIKKQSDESRAIQWTKPQKSCFNIDRDRADQRNSVKNKNKAKIAKTILARALKSTGVK